MKKNICKQAAAVILSAAIIFGTAGCGNTSGAAESSETESTSEYEETERVLVNHMTEKELDNLRIRANSDSYPSYSEVSDYAKERWGE